MRNLIIILATILSCGKINLTNKLKADEEKTRERISECIYGPLFGNSERNELLKMDERFLQDEQLLEGDGFIPLFEAVYRKSSESVYLLYKRYLELNYNFDKKWNIGGTEYNFYEYLKQKN